MVFFLGLANVAVTLLPLNFSLFLQKRTPPHQLCPVHRDGTSEAGRLPAARRDAGNAAVPAGLTPPLSANNKASDDYGALSKLNAGTFWHDHSNAGKRHSR